MAETELWETPLRDAAGQVTQNPAGTFHIEVQIGGEWFSLPVPAATVPHLQEAMARG